MGWKLQTESGGKCNPKTKTYFLSLLISGIVKGTLVQIWKSPYIFVFIKKQYRENFAFLLLRILELFAVKFINLLKSRLIFNIFYSF